MGTSNAHAIFAAGLLGGWETILILGVLLVLIGAKYLPLLASGLGMGWRNFKDATQELHGEIVPEKVSGGVYEALTIDNKTAEFIYPRRIANPLRDLVLFLAEGLGVGRIKVAPAAWGSVVGLVWFVYLLITRSYWAYASGTCMGVGVAVWLCHHAQKILKQANPPSIVLDEIVAMPICFLPWMTQAWVTTGSLPSVATLFSASGALKLAAVFVLFCLVDSHKPWPIRKFQRLPGGWGIVLDDVMAAIYVAVGMALGLSLFR